jgi:hypothetical protein
VTTFTVELGEELSDIACKECGGTHKSAYGFICKEGDAFAVYFATLHTGHPKPSVGLTLSLGKWWDDEAVDERSWVFLRVWPEENEYRMGLLDPALSHHRNYKALGNPLDRESALANPLRDDFFSVADFIVENDPAVTSYLDTGIVDVAQWQEARSRQPEDD